MSALTQRASLEAIVSHTDDRSESNSLFLPRRGLLCRALKYIVFVRPAVRPSVCVSVRHAFSSSRPSSSSSDQLHADQSDYARWLMVWMVGLVGFNRYLRGHSALQVLSSYLFCRHARMLIISIFASYTSLFWHNRSKSMIWWGSLFDFGRFQFRRWPPRSIWWVPELWEAPKYFLFIL